MKKQIILLMFKLSSLRKIKNFSCVFPEKKTITINCIISNLENINPYKEVYEYANTSDKINLLYINLELSNFFQANSKISGHENIITESDKSNKVCAQNSTSSTESNNISLINRSEGLSTGTIIGIIIHCVVELIAAVCLYVACSKREDIPPSNLNSESINN